MSRAVDTFVQILWKQFTHSFFFKSPVFLCPSSLYLCYSENDISSGFLISCVHSLGTIFFSVKVSIRLERLPIEGKYFFAVKLYN